MDGVMWASNRKHTRTPPSNHAPCVITLTKNENKLSQIAYNAIKCNENKAFWSKTNKSLILQLIELECGHRNRTHNQATT